ncbi:hypothetical protein BYT27DRAFT_7213473 [Phlegmacium glaucopus]|nr:hypothetical protein BYT27DRAFT_7213473 [Phlegmacium glaucopus]
MEDLPKTIQLFGLIGACASELLAYDDFRRKITESGYTPSLLKHFSDQLNKDQLTYYDSGIGTYAAPSSKSWNHWKQVIYNKIDVAIAWNFDGIVINAYSWLAQNYQPNDRIFLFGFSRGAYQARTLAGMIDKVGLIRKSNKRQIRFAYEIYADDHSDEALPSLRNENMVTKAWRKSAKFFRYAVGQQSEPGSPAPNMAKRFKDTFSRNIQVHFVGAWDTVSSVGIVRGKNLPGTTSADHICFFRHALALDECRVKFLPEYTYGGVAAKQVRTATMEGLEPMPRIKETWFAGTHSDIGGGNILNPNFTATCKNLGTPRKSVRAPLFVQTTAFGTLNARMTHVVELGH